VTDRTDEASWFADEPFKAFWEKGYRDEGVSTMGGPNFDLVEIVGALPSGCRVLDLGAGEGRNSFFLAGLGHHVTAIDRSASAMAKLDRLATERDRSVECIVGDIRDAPLPPSHYDVIMAHGVIDYLDNAEWHDLVARVQAATRPGGFNLYTCMIFNDDYPAPPEFRTADFKHSVRRGELASLYGSWETYRDDYYVKWDSHPGLGEHVHPVEKTVVRRTAGDGATAIREVLPDLDADLLPRAVFDTMLTGTDRRAAADSCGPPIHVLRAYFEGQQFGVIDQLVDGWDLEIWFYGRKALYVGNDAVVGRAIYETDPVAVRVGATR
jgi:tellurite methyltransferase